MTYVHQAPVRHFCRPPEIFGTHDDWELIGSPSFTAPNLKPGVRLPRMGDVWLCDCGQGWVLRPPAGRVGNLVIVAPEWGKETRWERWRRRRKK